MLKSRDLMRMTAAQMDEAVLGAMAAGERDAPTMLKEINERIRSYEAQYGLSTAELVAALTSCEREETLEICHWLFWADVRDSVVTSRS